MSTFKPVRAAALIVVLTPAFLACSATRAGDPTLTAGSSGALSAMQATAIARLDSLVGRWDFRVDLGARQTPGELWLFRRGAELTGTLAPAGTNTLPVRALVLRGDSAHMTVDTPEGPVTFDGSVDAGRTSMRGVVTYHHGQRFPMTATKRPPGPPAGA